MALALTRTPGQQIVVDGPCIIEVVKCRGSGVRLSIDATPDVLIRRAELIPRADDISADGLPIRCLTHAG